jgi:hypothetical protein
MTDGKHNDVRDTLDMIEKAQKIDDAEVEVAADDGGMSAIVQKAAKADEQEPPAD